MRLMLPRRSEQAQLLVGANEGRGVERDMALAQLQPLADEPKALGEQVGELPLSAHASPEGGAVERPPLLPLNWFRMASF